jgi:hypothetical protein
MNDALMQTLLTSLGGGGSPARRGLPQCRNAHLDVVPHLTTPRMANIRNVFACLVHETQDCVIDLVRNLRALDPPSLILLYNGGKNSDLLTTLSVERQGAAIHPSPRPAEWGRLHNFALDCMKWACQECLFDTLTIVDSDQLAIRPGYSEFLGSRLKTAPACGMLGNSNRVHLPGTNVGPAAFALQEIELWRPFLRRFPDGERNFVHLLLLAIHRLHWPMRRAI